MKNKWEISEETETLDSDRTIAQVWQDVVVTDFFSGTDEVPIACAWAIPDAAHTAVLVLNGRVETFLKYKEVIIDLYRNGFAVFTLDHRGQGLSGRMLSDTQKGYVAHFQHYVDDVLTFMQQFITTKWNGDLSLLCHSMGGAIGALTLLREPQYFSKAVLCSPMFGIKPALPNWLAHCLLAAGQLKSTLKLQQADYFFAQTGYIAHPFLLNSLTHSEARYRRMQELYAAQTELRLGGVTTEWLQAAITAMNTIEQQASSINTPALIFSSGNDRIIDNKRQARVANTFANAQYIVVNGARHELLCEADQYRYFVMQKSMQFLSE